MYEITSYNGPQGLLYIEQKLILRYLLSLFWLHLAYNGWLDSSQNRDSKCLGINFCFIYNNP